MISTTVRPTTCPFRSIRFLLLAFGVVAAGCLHLSADMTPQTAAWNPDDPLKHPLANPFEPGGKTGGVSGQGQKLMTEFTDEQWLAIVPTSSPKMKQSMPDGADSKYWQWDPHNPNQVKDSRNGQLYPQSQPPEIEKGVDMDFKEVDVPYYHTPKGKCRIQAQIDDFKTGYIEKALNQLSSSYASSHDEAVARRVALALDAWATSFPHYWVAMRSDRLPQSQADFEKVGWDICRNSNHNSWAHEWPGFAMAAFERIYDSEALQTLSKEKGYDVRAHIARDLFFNIGDFFVYKMPLSTATASNLSNPFIVLPECALDFNRPDYIDYMNKYLAAALDNFGRDGMDPESIMYGSHVSGINEAATKNVIKYFDVRKPTDAKDQAILDATKKLVATFENIDSIYDSFSLPNGNAAPFDDTPIYKFNPDPNRKANNGVSKLAPAYGLALLGCGGNDKPTHFYVAFNTRANHIQDGSLGIVLFSAGEDMLSNIPYFRAIGRAFVDVTMGHNTVTINRTGQPHGFGAGMYVNGNLNLFEENSDGIAVSDVDASWAYAPVPNCRYQRLDVLNGTDPSHPYVLDVFRVGGGQVHDYFLHGSITTAQTGAASFPLTHIDSDYPLLPNGEKWSAPDAFGPDLYGTFRDMSTGPETGVGNVTFANETEPAKGTRIHLVNDGSYAVYLGKSPVAGRGAATSDMPVDKSDDAKADAPKKGDTETLFTKDQWRPSLMVRHEGDGKEDLQSTFVSVLEPSDSLGSGIVKVEAVPLLNPGPDVVGVKVTFKDNREDTFLINLDSTGLDPAGAAQPISSADKALTLNGRIGIVSKSAGGSKAWIFDGTKFDYPGGELTSKVDHYQGPIVGVTRKVDGASQDAFITSASLPAGNELQGRWLSLTYGSYKMSGTAYGFSEQKNISNMFKIDHVEVANGKTTIVLTDDPCLKLDGDAMTETARPRRTFSGPYTFTVTMNAQSSK